MSTSGDSGDSGVDSRQVLLVGVCLFGLVTAAFLAPVTDDNEPVGIDGEAVPTDRIADLVDFLLGEDPDTAETPEDDGPVPDWLIDLLDGLPGIDGSDTDQPDRPETPETPGSHNGDDDGGGGGGIPDWLRDIADDLVGTDRGDGSGGGEANPCQVYVGSNPTPGTETTVLVRVEGEPAGGVRVWFNDEYVGRTGDRGTVAGEVPYVEELEVTVESPTDGPCAFSREPSVGEAQPRLDDERPATALGAGASVAAGVGVAGAASPAAELATSGAGQQTTDKAGTTLGSAPDPQRQQTTPGGRNNSSRYAVAGEPRLRIDGDPYPGATVTLVATVRDVPMRNATVTVDGERVGETDQQGRYRLSLPDRDSVSVAVSRGEISGQRRVDVWEVGVGFAPKLVVPGETTTLNVTRNGAPVENATVTLDNQTLGTTGPAGRFALGLPMRVDGTVSVATDAGTASIPLWRAYWLTAGATLLLVGLSTSTTWLTARRRDRESARRVALWWTGVAALFVGFAVWERRGLAVAGALVGLVGLVRYRRAVAAGGATAAEQVAASLDWCRRLVLRIVSGLEAAVDWLQRRGGAVVAWLRSLPLSVPTLLARLRARIGSFQGWLRGHSRRRIGAAALAVGVVLAATAADGARGFVLSALGVGLAALGWRLSQRFSTAGPGGAGTDTGSGTGTASAATVDGETPALRRLWRRLARWVTPSDWRTRTPAEVSRNAIEQGFPQGPVETLTEAFRDVEYGGEPEASRRERVRQAFERLEFSREGDERETDR